MAQIDLLVLAEHLRHTRNCSHKIRTKGKEAHFSKKLQHLTSDNYVLVLIMWNLQQYGKMNVQ